MINLELLSNRKIKDLLFLKEHSFRPGIYKLYIEKAQKRNLDLTFLDYLNPEEDEKNRKESIIRWGFTLAVIGNIFGIIIAFYILTARIKNQPLKRFDESERKKAI
ncbi:MAG: hypothetical protein JW982_12885 [Spirochaetes bacterium]|nr:hypothetical protein [Spirochaetota bacterium]